MGYDQSRLAYLVKRMPGHHGQTATPHSRLILIAQTLSANLAPATSPSASSNHPFQNNFLRNHSCGDAEHVNVLAPLSEAGGHFTVDAPGEEAI